METSQREEEPQQLHNKNEEDRPRNHGSSTDRSMPLMALNHVSRLCRSVEASVEFYTTVLGFVPTCRPPTLDFDGAWLFNYGVGIHLVQQEEEDGGDLPDASLDRLDPMDNHISFQCEDMGAMEQRLKDLGVKYLRRTINEEQGSPIDQLFFNDPDGFMIEICNCENLELVPAASMAIATTQPRRSK
ncbi:hypothetical protein GW17_00005139 [Ensete ventricosum]|nr:hypothetical protein GW17_00005139 [Ensete ventricosum]